MQNGSVTNVGHLRSAGQLYSASLHHPQHNVQEIGVQIVDAWTGSPHEAYNAMKWIAGSLRRTPPKPETNFSTLRVWIHLRQRLNVQAP